MRGTVLPAKPRRHRSTWRRHDAAPPPSRKVSNRTVGKSYAAPDGKVFRPSLFVTLTCPSYGRVTSDGTPVDPGAYDYMRAARDALHFAALFDRFIQNLRRYCGYDVQYFAAVEPQRRSNPPRSSRSSGMSGAKSGMSERLLTVAEAAEVLRTSERFPRRLIAERRIRFARIGRHVRIPESALREFIAAGLVEPITTRRRRRAA
jgi:excisionase family DNA binding protein